MRRTLANLVRFFRIRPVPGGHKRPTPRGGLPLKRILLLRHAKSDWDDYTVVDFDRPLSPRGREAAPRVAAWMREHRLFPDRVLCSAARRTRETWELMASELGHDAPVAHSRALYHASRRAILSHLTREDDTADAIAVVGHNPGIAEFASYYAVFGDEENIERIRLKYPTGALAVISFRIDRWADLPAAHGTLEHHVCPRELE